MPNRKSLLLVALGAGACGQGPAVPPPECTAAWAGEAAATFADAIEAATGADRSVWGEYDLGDGAYVLHAGQSEQGQACVGLWRDGAAIAFAALAEAPTVLTPLYGYYLRASATADSGIAARAVQPEPVRTWLEEQGVERAVLMPVEFPNFPIEMSTLFKTQLAIHEGFHITVQFPRWYDSTGLWPAWDHQPDRAGMQACYARDTTALYEERDILVRLIDALLDADTTTACAVSRDFFEHRASRYASLRDINVPMHDGAPGSCEQAEALMELEEGTADYASWSILYDIGQAPRDDLMRRYRAQQNDMYYLTGAMQLHAAKLMNEDGMGAVARAIADAQGVDDGSLTSVLRGVVGGFCQ